MPLHVACDHVLNLDDIDGLSTKIILLKQNDKIFLSLGALLTLDLKNQKLILDLIYKILKLDPYNSTCFFVMQILEQKNTFFTRGRHKKIMNWSLDIINLH